MNNFLITEDKPIRDYSRSGRVIVYPGGLAERAWWGECDRRGIPFVMVYRQRQHWAVDWDFITITAERYSLNRTPEFYDQIGAIIARFWRQKKPHWGYSTGRIGQLTKPEALECATLIYDVLDGAKVRVDKIF